jgi:hypothetical protein
MIHSLLLCGFGKGISPWSSTRGPPMPSRWRCARIARSTSPSRCLQAAKLNTFGPAEGQAAEQLRGWLEGLNDEDLGRYKM